MVEELKLAIKIDDATIEQSLLKQFANAQKMADKVVLDFKNVNFDDKQIEAKFKEMQKKAGQNPIDFSISGNTLDMLGQIDKRLTEIFSIGKGKSFIDSSSTVADIGKIENKINELNKKYEEAQKKLSSIGSGGISGKDVNLVDNKEFQKLSDNFEKIKGEIDELKQKINTIDIDTEWLNNFTTGLDEELTDTQAKLDNFINDFNSSFEKINTSTSNTLFNEESIRIFEKLLTSIESSLSSIKGILVDVGDGEELSPLLREINNIQTAIVGLSSSFNNLHFNMNIDMGTDNQMDAKIQEKAAKALNAYEKLFNGLKLSGYGGEVVNNKFFDFDINKFDTTIGKVKAYKDIIERLRKEAKEYYGGTDLLRTQTDDKLWRSASSAGGQLTQAINETAKNKTDNPLTELFGKTDLSGVIEQLNTIVSKLDEISVSAKGFTETFKNGLNVNASVEEIEKLTNRVKELETELAKIKTPTTVTAPQESNISSGRKDAFPDKDVSTSVESATNSIKEENNALEQNTQKVKENTQAKEQNANVNFNKYDKRLDSYNGKVDKYQATIARFNDGGWTSDEYLKNVQAIKDAVNEYETLLNELKGKDASLVTSDDISKLDEYDKKIKDTIATVTNMSAAEKGYNFVSGQKELDKIHKLLNENSKMSSEAKAEIRAYYAEIESGNPSMSLDRIHGEIMKIYNAEVEAGRAGRSFFDTLKNSGFHQIAAQMAGMFGLYDVINGLKQVASTVIDINTQITDLAKVSEATSSQIYDDFSSYADIAKDIGGTISDTISATADWSRNGYNLPDSKELARVALLYKNVGDGIDIDSANKSLISTLRGFKMEADEAEKIIDIFNNVSNNEPIDSGGIGEALQRSAASFNAANTSLQESVALISTTNSVIQNPEKVGNMWKVVSMRIRSATSELEQAGEDTDGLVTSTADLQKMIKAMTGYDILESDGKTFKSIYDIVLNISKVWNNLSDLDQSSLLQALAGKQQSNALAAALSNPELLEKSYQEAMNSAGSAAEEEKKYQQSIQYSIDQTKAKLEELSADLLSSDFLKGAIDSGGKLIEVLDGIVKSGNAIPAVATAIAAAFSFKNVG